MTDLEDQLTDHLNRTADQAAPWPQYEAIVGDAEMMRITSTSHHHARRPARRHVLVAAAAIAVLGGAGAVALLAERPALTPMAPSDQPVSQPDPAETETDISFDDALFPSASVEAINAAGYETPEAVVEAYMADRTAPANVPDGYSISYEVRSSTMVDDDTAVVAVGLATPDDTGDLGVAVRRHTTDQGDRWWVTAATTIPGELGEVRLADGTLFGTYTPWSGGVTHLYAYDALTNELVGSTIIDLPVVGNPVVENTESQSFEIDTGDRADILLRYWNVVSTDGTAYQFANFGEVRVPLRSA